MAKPYFTKALFDFLKDLAAHNDREWFQANKERYEEALILRVMSRALSESDPPRSRDYAGLANQILETFGVKISAAAPGRG